MSARNVTTPETRRAPDGPGDALADLDRAIAQVDRLNALVGRAQPSPSDDVHRINYLVAGLGAEDRALVRALAERLAVRG